MKPAALFAAILLIDAALHAQQPVAGNSLDLEHTVSRCAIGMFARQGGGLHFLRAGKNDQPAEPAMEPSLTLHDAAGKHIVSATITAHGFGAPKGATPLQTGSQDSSQKDMGGSLVARPVNRTNFTNSSDPRPRLTRTLTVRFQPDGDSDFSSDFLLPGFAVLEVVDLNSITYADGSIENFEASICHARPSPLMLVSGN